MGLYRAQAFEHWRQQRRPLPPTVPFPWNRATEKYVRIDIAGPYDAYSLADTDSTVGNYIVYERVCLPSGVEVFVDSDLIPFTVDPSTGRQSFRYREWISSSKTWLPVNGVVGDYTTYYVNNATPTAVGTIPNQQAYTNILWEGPILDDYITDAEGDAITWTVNSGTLPTGISVQAVTLNLGLPGERTVKRLRGTPATGQHGTDTIVMRGTDIVGAFVNLAAFDLVTGIGQQMPDVIDETRQDGLDAIALVMTSSVVTVELVVDLVIAIGNIVETQPAAGIYLPPGSPVLVTVAGAAIPVHVGLAQATVVAALEALTLVVTVSTMASDDYEVGLVISMTDSTDATLFAGDVVSAGSSVTVFVSSGPATPDTPRPVGRFKFKSTMNRIRFSADH